MFFQKNDMKKKIVFYTRKTNAIIWYYHLLYQKSKKKSILEKVVFFLTVLFFKNCLQIWNNLRFSPVKKKNGGKSLWSNVHEFFFNQILVLDAWVTFRESKEGCHFSARKWARPVGVKFNNTFLDKKFVCALCVRMYHLWVSIGSKRWYKQYTETPSPCDQSH